MREINNTLIYKKFYPLLSLLFIVTTYTFSSEEDYCKKNTCIDLSVMDLESISQKTKDKTYEFFYLSETETRFFANIPKKSGCSVIAQSYTAESSPSSKPSLRMSTTPQCLKDLQKEKQRYDEENLWVDSAQKNSLALVLGDNNIDESEIVMIRKNSSFTETDIPSLSWLPEESFKLEEVLSNNDHFIYSESLKEKEYERLEKEENLNNLIAELDGNIKNTYACIQTKNAKNLETAQTALSLLKEDLKKIFDQIETTEQERTLTSLEKKILELETLLNNTQAEVSKAIIEQELARIEQELIKQKSATEVIYSMDKLDQLYNKHPAYRNEIATLQRKVLTRSVQISGAEDYTLIIDKLDQYLYSPQFDAKFTQNLMAQTFTKAVQDSDTQPLDAQYLLDSSKRMSIDFQKEDPIQFQKFFDITLSLSEKAFLSGEFSQESRNKYVSSLADFNKDTKSKNKDLIINKISDIYAYELSPESIDSMNNHLTSLKNQKRFNDQDLFNIYNNTASFRKNELYRTGNLNGEALGSIHNLMIGLSDTVKLKNEMLVQYNQNMIDLAQVHIPMLVNTGDKNFSYYYSSYNTHLQKEMARLSKEYIKTQTSMRSGRKIDKKKDNEKYLKNPEAIEKQFITLQQLDQKFKMDAQAYPVIVKQAHLEAQQQALNAQQQQYEQSMKQQQTQDSTQRGPGVATGPGMQPQTTPAVQQQTSVIQNQQSIMNGVNIQPVQLPQSLLTK